MVALFCGSRDWTDREAIRRDVAALPDGAVVIEGGARGADRIAREEALARGLHVATVEAQWDRFGKTAGYRRNAAMVSLHPDVVYAYPISRPDGSNGGTGHTMALAQRKKVKLVVRRSSTVEDYALPQRLPLAGPSA